MILTYKYKHNRDFSKELKIAKKCANTALKIYKENPEHFPTSKDLKCFNLPSTIKNNIARKYLNKKRLNVKEIKNPVLVLSNQAIRLVDGHIEVTCLKLKFPFYHTVTKVNYAEIGKKYIYISCTVDEELDVIPVNHIGVDRNATGHLAVVNCYETNETWMLGRKCFEVRKKYKNLRAKYQKVGKFRKCKKIKMKESNICRDINHKISKEIVDKAVERQAEIVLEDLTGIRKSTKHKNKKSSNLKYTLNSWSFYELQRFIEYKAKKRGIKVRLIDPYMTSQTCSHCGHKGIRSQKDFVCPICGHMDHADINAARNIAHMGLLKSEMQNILELADWTLNQSDGYNDTPQRESA